MPDAPYEMPKSAVNGAVDEREKKGKLCISQSIVARHERGCKSTCKAYVSSRGLVQIGSGRLCSKAAVALVGSSSAVSSSVTTRRR